MISKNNLKEVLFKIGYVEISDVQMEKEFKKTNCKIIVDFKKERIIYPELEGLKINMKTTCNFSQEENFVVLECVTRLLDKGYRPESIELEKKWNLGHELKGGRADIIVNSQEGKTLFIVECKRPGEEYKKEKKNLFVDGGQLFSYWQQERSCKWLVLYTSDYIQDEVNYISESIDCSDDENIKLISRKDESIKLYENANNNIELFEVWEETYENRLVGDVIFRDDSVAYQIGIKPLRKKDLKDFAENDKIVNKFEEILRHNNVSDKENAFNRLIALFICKLVDEMTKEEYAEVDFQYKIGTDTFETLQDRLQRLHKEGMEKFMREDIFYIPNDYADRLIKGYTGQQRESMIADLRENLRKLKFYSNNDFAFKDVHNEELFLQNGKILVEVVQLFENYRIIDSKDLQMLGDLFEQLLNKGFKQNEGQFFTPMPITKFIWDCLPVMRIMKKENTYEFPKIIDFACGAGHFLTQGYDVINDIFKKKNLKIKKDWERDKIYGIEKDYRLARVSKISLFMHGAGHGNIIFGDGLENYSERGIKPFSFDILVANPPYAVKAFKPYLKLKKNNFEVIDCVSKDGSEIEVLFIERMAQLLKPNSIASIILPSGILNKNGKSFTKAREIILENFKIVSITNFGSKTFGATGTNTVVLFLKKFDEPPKRKCIVNDTVEAIFENRNLSEWEDKEIFKKYLERIEVSKEVYEEFITKKRNYTDWNDITYFKKYLEDFKKSAVIKNLKSKKTFKNLSKEEQEKNINKEFYKIYGELEKEKIRFFSLVYNQTTLIVMAPTSSAEQDEFLGYKWNTRKGKEGIQILKYGGKLFNGEDSEDKETMAYVVKNSFLNKKVSNTNEEYYYYLNLPDMLDFNSVNFSKSLNLKKIRKRQPRVGYKEYTLNDKEFELIIGKRVVDGDKLIKEDGKYPVYSANVLQEKWKTDELLEKNNFKTFDKASILWGIDGDWMVNYIPKCKPFYPTDHCGVLRTNSDNILPEYLMYALMVEGKYESFSRRNRAALDRIKELKVWIPSLVIQKAIVESLRKLDDDIAKLKKNIEEHNKKLKLKFNEILNEVKVEKILLKDCTLIAKGEILTREEAQEGDIPVVGGGKIPSCYHNEYNRDKDIITISGSGANAGFVNYWDIPIFATDCNTIKSIDEKKYMTDWIYFSLFTIQKDIYKLQRGSGQPHVYGTDIAEIEILIPTSIKSQQEFSEFFKAKNKVKYEMLKKIEKLERTKEQKIEKEFLD